MTERAMFPLGMVLFPGAVLPLRVFEPRYQQLTEHAMTTDGRFGVVLISRGHEVGGGDERTDIGCLTEIARAQAGPDGQWALLTVGVKRIRVDQWLDDAPYPRAEIEELAETPLSPADREQLEAVAVKLRRVLALRSELGEQVVPFDVVLDDNSTIALYRACASSPFGPADKQALLEAPDPVTRLTLLEQLIDDDLPYLEQRLAGG